MKPGHLFFIPAFLLSSFIQAQTIVSIPDPVLKNCLLSQFVDRNNDGQIQNSEAEATTSLTIEEYNLNSLQGLQAFTNLTSLTFGLTNVKTLDLSALTKLSYLMCSHTDIDSINLSKNTALKYIYLSYTKVSGLDFSQNVLLDSLVFRDNPSLTKVKIPNAANLKNIICYYNKLTELDVTHCPKLEVLQCYGGLLTSLDLSQCANLKQLYCHENQISNLNVNGCINLQVLQSQGNQLSTINISTNTALTEVYLSGNYLKSLNVSNCKSLRYLGFAGNFIKTIDLKPCTELAQLSCSQNYLSGLELTQNKKLTQVFCNSNLSLDSIIITEDQLVQTLRQFDWVKDNFAVWATSRAAIPVLQNKWTTIPIGTVYNAHTLWVGAFHLAVINDNEIYYHATDTPFDYWRNFYPPSGINNRISNSIFIKKLDYSDDIFFLLIKDTAVNRYAILKIGINHNIYEHTYIGDEGDVINDLSYNNGDKIIAAGNNGVIIIFNVANSTYERQVIPQRNNLTAISALYDNAYVAENGVLLKINLSSFSSDTIGPIDKDVKTMSLNGTYYHVIGGENLNTFFDQKPEITKALHDFGALNVRDISYRTGIYIATQKGLFAAPEQGNGVIRFLQFAPEHSLEDIIRLGGYNNKLYALTKDGRVLVTNRETIALKPYANIKSVINCSKEYSELRVTYPMEGTYKWFYDDVVINRSSSHDHAADSGRYILSVVIKNGLYADTSSTPIHILNKPGKFLSLAIPDTTICKNEGTQINLFNTDTLFRYNLTSTDLLQNYGSVRGNGNKAVLTSGSLWENEFGKFRIWIKSAYSDCNRYTDSVYSLRIERTKADFIYDEINPAPGEDVHFYNKSKEASTFSWNFGPVSQPLSSSLKDPVVQFYPTGETGVKLKAISPYGCADSILWKGPVIVNEKALPAMNCWTTNMFNKDPDWAGSYTPYIQDMKLIEGNDMIISGHYNDNTFNSKYGQGVKLPNQSGAYIARYSKNGVIKWLIKTKRDNYQDNSTYYSSVNSVFVDSANNIYATGNIDTRNSHLQFSRGDTVYQNPAVRNDMVNNATWIFKTDKNGTLLQHARVINCNPEDITVDKQGNIVVTGWLAYNTTPENFLYIGGGDSLYPLKSIPSENDASAYRFILKTDRNGKFLWANYIGESRRDYSKINEISLDKAGNIFMSGDFSSTMEFHSVDASLFKTRILNAPGSYGPYLYVAKFSPQGNFLWHTSASTNDPTMSVSRTHVQDMQVMEDGTVYITGSNFVYVDFTRMNFTHSDGTSSSSSVGGFFVSKLNAAGKVIWTSGNRYSYYGGGTSIDVKGNKLAVTSYFQDNFNMYDSTDIVSANESKTKIKMDISKVFVLEYDTAGILKSISPMNIGFGPLDQTPTSIKWVDDKTIYYAMEAYGNNNSADSAFTPFCDEISLSKFDGFWGKMTLGTGAINNIGEKVMSFGSRSVKIYPNPASSGFTLEAPLNEKLISVTVLNMQGQEIAQEKIILSANQFNYKTGLANGMYNIRIHTDKSTYLQKLIIAKD